MATLNRSAIVAKPKQPFLDWLHTADPASYKLTLRDLVREPTIYLVPECDRGDQVNQALSELCKEILPGNWQGGSTTKRLGLRTVILRSSVTGSDSSCASPKRKTIRFGVIFGSSCGQVSPVARFLSGNLIPCYLPDHSLFQFNRIDGFRNGIVQFRDIEVRFLGRNLMNSLYFSLLAGNWAEKG